MIRKVPCHGEVSRLVYIIKDMKWGQVDVSHEGECTSLFVTAVGENRCLKFFAHL
jgi:hypothetical protein